MLIKFYLFLVMEFLYRNCGMWVIGRTTVADTTNGSGNPKEVDAFYDRTLIQPIRTAWIYGKYGQKRDLKEKTDTIRFSKFPILGTQPIALTEGINPEPQKMGKYKIEATVSLYGGYVELTEECEVYRIDPEVAIAQERVSWQAVETIDQITRDSIIGGTNCYYVNGTSAGAENSLTLIGDWRKIARAMQIKGTPYFKGMITASNGISTSAINNAWIAIISPEVLYDIENTFGTSFTPVSKYASQNGVEDYEMGAFGYFRYIVTPNCPIAIGGGASGSTTYANNGTNYNVHKCLILGPDAFGVVNADGGIKTIRKDKSEIGGPLELYSTAGWKSRYTAKILDDDRMYRYQTCVSL